jgi:hypothetical protein
MHEFKAPLFKGPKDDDRTEVVRRPTRRSAVVRDRDTDKQSFVRSQLPLEVADANKGRRVPVDLDLHAVDDRFEPQAGLVPLTLDAGEPHAVIGKDQIGVGVPAVSSAPGVLSNGRAFYGDIAADTDAAFQPLPTGLELFMQLRSADAPERLTVDFDLPEGASIEPATSERPIPGDPPDSYAIRQGDKTLGWLYQPLAYDADGVTVPSTMRVDGTHVTYEVRHREADAHYPILVDPTYALGVYRDYYDDWYGWSWSQTPSAQTYSAGFGAAMNNCVYACGLYQSIPTNSPIPGGAYAN